MKKSVLKTLISVAALTFVTQFTIFETSALGDVGSEHHIDFTEQGRNMRYFDPIADLPITLRSNAAQGILKYLYETVKNIPVFPAPEDKQGRWDVRADRYFYARNMYGDGTPMINQIPEQIRNKFLKLLGYWVKLLLQCESLVQYRDSVQEFIATQLALLNQHGGHCGARVISLLMQAYDNTYEFASRIFSDGSETTLTGTLKKELQQKLHEHATMFVEQNTTAEVPLNTSLGVSRHEPLYFVNAVVSDFNKIYLPQETSKTAIGSQLRLDGTEEARNQLIRQILKPSTIIKTLDKINKDWGESCVDSHRRILDDLKTLTNDTTELPFDTFCKLVDDNPDKFKQDLKSFIESNYARATDTEDPLYDEESAESYTSLLAWVQKQTDYINLNSLINDAVIIYGPDDENISTSNLLNSPDGVRALVCLYLTCDLELVQ